MADKLTNVAVLYRDTETRTRSLLHLHRTLTDGQPGRPTQRISDLLRATFVTGVAAFDALVTDLVEVLLDELLATGPPPKALMEKLDNAEQRRAIIGDIDPSRARARVVHEMLSKESRRRRR